MKNEHLCVLGQAMAMQNVLWFTLQHHVDLFILLSHHQGDWEKLYDDDPETNKQSLMESFHIMSNFHLNNKNLDDNRKLTDQWALFSYQKLLTSTKTANEPYNVLLVRLLFS